MLVGFFDDSGKESDKQHPYVCLAGYLGKAQMWAPFITQWQHMLMFHQLPCLHMKDMMSEEWALKSGWDWKKRQEVTSDFIKTIKSARLVGFGVGIDADFWRSLPPMRLKRFGNAQQFAFQRIMRMVSKRLDLTSNQEPVEMCFDNDAEFSGSRLNLFNKIKKNYSGTERFVSLAFSQAELYPPLQAADLLAWEMRTHLVRRGAGKESTPRFKQLMTLLPHQEFDNWYTSEFWDAQTAEAHLAAIESEVLSARLG